MSRVRRVSLFSREIRVFLSSAAIDILLQAASVLSEGQFEDDRYYGSTMVTIDVARASDLVSDACDVTTAERVADLLETDDAFLRRARRIAGAEARRLAGRALAGLQIDMRVRRSGNHLNVDMDVEADR